MKILLLTPPRFNRKPWGMSPSSERLRNPPLGIAYIASVLEKEGYRVVAKDLYITDWHEVYKLICDEAPDIVGISCLTDMRASAFRLVYMVKAFSNDIYVVMGGAHATLFPEQLLDNLPLDAVVIGEGEETFKELVKVWESGGSLETVEGIAYRDNEHNLIRRTKPRKRIEDLDSLPMPAYHHFNYNSYVPPSYLEGFMYRGTDLGRVRWISINTSRGCPYNCRFCSEPKLWKRNWIGRSPKSVVDEMEMLHRNFGYQHFNFAEDTFTINKERVISICQEIKSRRLDLTWVCNMRLDTISREMLTWMYKVGCAVIAFGVESGSPRILKRMGKHITIQQIEEGIRLAREVGIPHIAVYLIVGYPGETDETIMETLTLIRRIEPVQLRIGFLTLYPATVAYEYAKAQGFINDDYWVTEGPSPIYTADHSLDKLREWKVRLLYPSPPVDPLPRKLVRSARQLLWKTTGIWVERRPKP